MAWTDLAAAFAYGSKLTSAQMQNLRDNVTALANGDAGAPPIQTAAYGDATVTVGKLAYAAGEVRLVNTVPSAAYYEVLGADGSWRQCCPTFDNSGGGTCFPAGSMVLMADMTWKPVEHVHLGDLVFSSHGPATVMKQYVTRLGSRKMYRMADNSLLWSEEHSFWVKRSEELQYIWSMSREALEREAIDGLIGGLKDFSKVLNGVAGNKEAFAYFNGSKTWKENTPEHVAEYDGQLDMPLYLPLTEKGELIVVNGYLVGASVNEFETDYTKLKWED